MRTTCSITKTCVVAHKRRNLCYWGSLKFPHALLSPVSAHLRAKEKHIADNEKLTISHTFCSSLSTFPALSLENFPTDTARGNRSAAPTTENFPRTTSNTFSDRSDLIRSVCLRDLSTQHHWTIPVIFCSWKYSESWTIERNIISPRRKFRAELINQLNRNRLSEEFRFRLGGFKLYQW